METEGGDQQQPPPEEGPHVSPEFTRWTGLGDPEVAELVRDACFATFGGFFFGGVTGIKNASAEFIEENRTTKFKNQVHMQSEMNNAVLRRFAFRGSRWGWQIGLFYTLFKLGEHTLQHQRQQRDVLNMVGSGGAVGTLFGLRHGPRGAGAGLLVGAGLSLWLGLILQGSWIVEKYIKKEQAALACNEDTANIDADALLATSNDEASSTTEITA